MSSDQIRAQMRQAAARLKAGDRRGAAGMLAAIVRHDRDNADAWLLLAHALDQPKRIHQALDQVERLRPGDARAAVLRTRLEGPSSSTPSPMEDPFAILDEGPIVRPVMRRDEEDPFAGIESRGLLKREGLAGAQTASKPVVIKPTVPVRSSGATNIAVLFAVGTLIVSAAVAIFIFASASQSSSGGTARCNNSPCGSLAMGQRGRGQLSPERTHEWSFTGQAGQRLSLEANAAAPRVDPVLTVYGPDGALIAENDDVNLSANRNARVDLVLPASGMYRAVVSTWDNAGGAYEVYLYETAQFTGLSSSQPGHCDVDRRGAPGSTVDVTCGEISGGRSTGRINTFERHLWTVHASAGQTVVIEANPRDSVTDPVLRVYDSFNNLVAENDDAGRTIGDLGSMVTFTVQRGGTFTIDVTTYNNRGGTYEVIVR